MAMYSLGLFYYFSDGGRQDYSKAKEWFEKAAEHGNEYAMFQIGFLYEAGNGVEQSYNKAKEWYEKSAGLGCESAIKALKRLS